MGHAESACGQDLVDRIARWLDAAAQYLTSAPAPAPAPALAPAPVPAPPNPAITPAPQATPDAAA